MENEIRAGKINYQRKLHVHPVYIEDSTNQGANQGHWKSAAYYRRQRARPFLSTATDAYATVILEYEKQDRSQDRILQCSCSL